MKSEKHTRKQLIDIQLTQVGWDIADRSQVIEEYDIKIGLPDDVAEPQTPYQGHLFSDYVLLGKDGKIIAVVEAKKKRMGGHLLRLSSSEKTVFLRDNFSIQKNRIYKYNFNPSIFVIVRSPGL